MSLRNRAIQAKNQEDEQRRTRLLEEQLKERKWLLKQLKTQLGIDESELTEDKETGFLIHREGYIFKVKEEYTSGAYVNKRVSVSSMERKNWYSVRSLADFGQLLEDKML